MVDLLKAFGRGILYVILCPFFLLALALFAVIGLIAFILQLFKSIFCFFTGRKFFPELPEDKELRLRREAEQARNNPAPQPEVMPQAAPAQNQQSDLIFEEMYDESAFEEEPAPVNKPAPTPTSVEEACFLKEPAPAPIPESAPMPEAKPEPIKEELLSDKDADDAPLADFINPMEDTPVMREERNEILEVYKPRGNNDSFDDDYDDDTDSGVNIRFDD